MAKPPEARRALVAGEYAPVLDYDRGRLVTGETPIAVVPVLMRPGDTAAPGMSEGILLRPAKQMDEITASITLRNMIANCLLWTRDYPFAASGEEAEALRFFNGLRARHQARLDAKAFGGDVPEEVEGYEPPAPEAMAALNNMRAQVTMVLECYDRALRVGGMDLLPEDRARVTRLRTVLAEGVAHTQLFASSGV